MAQAKLAVLKLLLSLSVLSWEGGSGCLQVNYASQKTELEENVFVFVPYTNLTVP